MSDMRAKRFRKSLAWDGNGYTLESRTPDVPAPSSLTATPSGSAVTVTFTDNSGGLCKHYIERSTDSGLTWNYASLLDAGIVSQTYNALSDGAYLYRAKALHVATGFTSTYSNTDDAVVSSGGGGGSGTLLFSTNFATGTSGLAFPFGTRGARTTNNPKSGSTHAYRFNLKSGVVEGASGLVGASSITGYSSQTADFNHGITLDDYDQVTLILPFRFDHCTWGGRSNPEVNAKLVYIGQVGTQTQNGFYLADSAMGGANGNLNWGDNGNWGDTSDWQNSSIAWLNPSGNRTGSTYGATGHSWGADGLWHTLKIQFDFLNGGDTSHNRGRVFIDDYPVLSRSGYNNIDSNGWVRLPATFRPNRIRLGYADATSSSNAVDGTGTACGLQWDENLEVWSGLV